MLPFEICTFLPGYPYEGLFPQGICIKAGQAAAGPIYTGDYVKERILKAIVY
jgi:hypothetical protein